MDVPTYHKVLIVTDAAINIAPTLEEKADICQNAIDLAHAMGVELPKLALLCSGRDGHVKDAGDAGRRGAVQDGRSRPDQRRLAGRPAGVSDNAISKEAARTKGINSEVSGDPDILLAPDLEAGNILAKLLSFLGNSDSAGLVLGAKVPIILTSRADNARAKIASCAVAMLGAHARRTRQRP
jgi:phosphotransacetylase